MHFASFLSFKQSGTLAQTPLPVLRMTYLIALGILFNLNLKDEPRLFLVTGPPPRCRRASGLLCGSMLGRATRSQGLGLSLMS